MNHSFILAIALVLALVCNGDTVKTTTHTRTVTVGQSKETLTIKNKLAKAEGRVGDLISRLDSVQDDAARTKNEIHSTLLEVWKIVDMLGQDRCGEVVDKVRVAQKKAENKVSELQEEITVNLKIIEELKLSLAQKGDSVTSVRKEIQSERSRREQLEAEVRDLRDKLHWASAVSNETQAYEVVSERLQALLVVVSERTQLLQRILSMVGESHNGFSEWRTEVESLTTLVRDAERDFSGGYQSAAVEGLRRQTQDLEKRLRDALHNRDVATNEKNSLKRTIESMQKKVGASTFGFGKGSKERIIVQREGGTSMIGVVTLCVISLCSGAIAVFFMGLWQNNRDIAGAGAAAGDKYEYTPSVARTSPGFSSNTAAPSPLNYSGHGSASKTPGSRGSTPRRY